MEFSRTTRGKEHLRPRGTGPGFFGSGTRLHVGIRGRKASVIPASAYVRNFLTTQHPVLALILETCFAALI